MREMFYVWCSRCSRRSCGVVSFGSCSTSVSDSSNEVFVAVSSLRKHCQGTSFRWISCLSCCIPVTFVALES